MPTKKRKTLKKNVRSLVTAVRKPPAKKSAKPKLLSGGNPQIAKADGDAPVQAYINALSGWKHDAARRIDALVTQAAPGLQKAVRWNSPMSRMAGQGWFLSIHTFTKYIKGAFCR